MDHYHLWFDLRHTGKDLEFCDAVDRYLGRLKEEGLIEGHRLARRKLGFGPAELGEFHIEILTTDMSQLERAFQRVGTRAPDIERLHAAVFSAVTGFRSALYRDFPDTFRARGAPGPA